MPKTTKSGASNQWAFPELSQEQVEAMHPEAVEARLKAEASAPEEPKKDPVKSAVPAKKAAARPRKKA